MFLKRNRASGREGEKESERQTDRQTDRLIEPYFSTVKILTQRPTHISAVATVLLVTKTFIVKYYDRRL